MPRKLVGPCTVYPCPNKGTHRGKCADHAAQAEAVRNVERKESKDVYNSPRWRSTRRQVLRDRPTCDVRGCFEASEEVDHVIPIDLGGAPYDPANLRALCKPHHSRKTATVDRARRKAKS